MSQRDPTWQVKVFYDGECPLCEREIRFLQKRDAGLGAVLFEDIAGPSFDARSLGLDHSELMARIHGMLPDGTVVEGVEVFRRAYAAVDLGWLVAPTRWAGFRQLTDLAYRVFARNRLRWTSRATTCEAGACSPLAKAPRPGP